MDLSETRFTAHNLLSDFEQPEDISEYFNLTAPANSTLWRKPSSGDDVSAPMILSRLQESFCLAEVTVTAEMEAEWDQAGLVIFVGMTPNQRAMSAPRLRPNQRGYETQPGKWLKVGLGLADEEVGVATAVAQPGCGPDWSFTPVFSAVDPKSPYSFRRSSLRLKLERVGEDLWVWYRLPETHPVSNTRPSPDEVSREWRKARELSEFFAGVDVNIKSGIWVGCYAGRPLEMDDGDGNSELFVEFEELMIV